MADETDDAEAFNPPSVPPLVILQQGGEDVAPPAEE